VAGSDDIVAGSEGDKVYFFDNYDIIKITAAERAIDKVKSMGLNPIEAINILEKAKQELSKGNYDKAMELAKQILELEKALPEFKKSSSAIEKAKSMGLNPIEAINTLEKAEQEFSKGNYDKAIELAKRSYSLAIDVDQDGVANDEDFAPMINNNYIYLGLSITLPTAVTLTYTTKKIIDKRREQRRRYEMEKQKVISEMEELLKT